MSSRFIFRFTVWVFALLGLTGLYAYAIEPRMIVLEEVKVAIDGLPPELDGFTIGVMADLHLDNTPVSTVRAAARRLAFEKPDVTVIAGDFAAEAPSLSALREILEPLGTVYAVPGNWDRWSENPGYQDLVPVEMLINRGILVADGVWLCGIDDALLGFPSIEEAVSGAPEGAVRILLAHEPDVAYWVRPEYRVSLQISGHSHGGQIRLPYKGPVLLPPMGRGYPAGLAHTPTHTVYTTRGIGMSHIPVRFLCPPEVTLIKLVTP